jgi:hypothetical protein
VDLIALVEADLGGGEITGKWVKFNCPFCRSIRRDEKKYLLVTNGDETRGGWWICKFCNKRGDVIAWLKDKRRLSFQDALDVLRMAPIRNARQAVPTVG